MSDPYNIFEDAYREHAIRLNWKRPRGHKLSWRRLNREQRIEAIRRWRVHKR